MVPNPATEKNLDWWKTAVVYQVFPATFKDSNDDGIGDLPGIISKLDYVQSLGADAIWLCPMYDGPQVDMGYDVSNYQAVYPPLGTVEDVERLIRECHDRGMRVMLDLVISHTSTEHPWFQASRSAQDDPKRDWYIWRPANYDDEGGRHPPNNWKSVFGEGSAWEWDEHTEQYYLHMFTEAQPDLNWENPEMRKAVLDNAVLFWVEKGVDAFRIDAANMFSKPEGLPDAPDVLEDWPWQPANAMVCNGPKVHEFLAELYAMTSEHGVVIAGEIPFTAEKEDILRYCGGEDKQLDMVFQFNAVGQGMGTTRKYDVTPGDFSLEDFKTQIAAIEESVSGTTGWTASFIESHDQGRSISRFGSDKPEHRVASGKMLAIMMATLSGTLYLYQGEEIGMVNVPDDFPIEEMKDDCESGLYYKFVRENCPEKTEHAEAAMRYLGRHNGRMPMPWDENQPHGGFSSATPLTKPHPYTEINVAAQEKDEGSVLSFWKKMIAMRKEEYTDVFVFGEFRALHLEHPQLFIYLKEGKDQTALVVLNFSEEPTEWMVFLDEAIDLSKCELLVSNMDGPTPKSHAEQNGFADELMRPQEGRVYITM